jgi:hypothetical protein
MSSTSHKDKQIGRCWSHDQENRRPTKERGGKEAQDPNGWIER